MHKQKLVLLLVVVVAVFTTLYIHFTKKADSASPSLTNIAATMSNSRLSYKAGVSAGTSGASGITIKSSGYSDNDTNHLFPGDIVCFTDAGQNGCIGNTTYTVDSINDATHFNLTSPLTDNLDTSGYVVSTESGTLTITTTIPSTVPIGGSLVIAIPAATVVAPATTHDGIPDSSGTIASSGFDLNQVVAGSISKSTVSGSCTAADWGTASVSYGTGGALNPHTITFTRATSTCAAGAAISITIGASGTALVVNPAPITSGHAQGSADVYGISVTTKDGSGNVINGAIPRVAPVEAVFISTTVDESLSLTVAAVTAANLSGSSYCGTVLLADAVDTTATTIPWGHLQSPNHFYTAAQQLTINTNAGNGYTVTLSESDQMGKNGNVCTGTAPSAGNYTFGTGTCIRNTACSAGGCSNTAMADWTDPTNYVGLGYSLASQSGSDALFYYNQGGRTFNTKELSDLQGLETPQAILSNSGPVSGSSAYVCYRISIPGNQPSGYYYNIAKYTATATF